MKRKPNYVEIGNSNIPKTENKNNEQKRPFFWAKGRGPEGGENATFHRPKEPHDKTHMIYMSSSL